MSELGILQVYSGPHIPAIKRIKLFSPNEWEEFVEEWLLTKINSYHSIERLGGAGDQGRDVVGYISDPNQPNYTWDNFQCKHYDHALRPTDVWTEFGKLCYFTYKGNFPVPKKYYFVAPLGIGTGLSDLLRKPDKLKEGLIKNWNKYCQDKITKKESIKLDKNLLTYLDNFDFSIFYKITPLQLVTEHKETRHYVTRFGGGLPERPEREPTPENIADYELPYINMLLKAYSSVGVESFHHIKDLFSVHKYNNHLSRARECFHHAEQLKNFSRDTLPPGIFDSFKDEIFSGTIDVSEDEHASGFTCVKAVEKESRKLIITANPLSLCSDGNDRVGVCHHLANESKLDWLGDESE